VKTSDRDMKLMALGEIGAFLVSITSAAGIWMYLEGIQFPLRFVAALAVMYIVCRYALRFVHLGYKPESTSSQ
jgi:hypothetical protein